MRELKLPLPAFTINLSAVGRRDWEMPVGRIVKNKEECFTSVILSAFKDKNDNVFYVVCKVPALLVIPYDVLVRDWEMIA